MVYFIHGSICLSINEVSVSVYSTRTSEYVTSYETCIVHVVINLRILSQPPCSRLWCSTAGGEENGCRTQHMPWADGTPCGPGHWCVKSACVRRSPAHAQSRARVDGQWGDWRKWSACSRSCGGGIRSRARECDGPAPANGGLYCKGDRVQNSASLPS